MSQHRFPNCYNAYRNASESQCGPYSQSFTNRKFYFLICHDYLVNPYRKNLAGTIDAYNLVKRVYKRLDALKLEAESFHGKLNTILCGYC